MFVHQTMRIMQAYLITFSQSMAKNFCCLKHPLIQLLVCFVLFFFLAALCSASLLLSLDSSECCVQRILQLIQIWHHLIWICFAGYILQLQMIRDAISWLDSAVEKITYIIYSGSFGSSVWIHIHILELNPKNIRSNPSTWTWYCKNCRGSFTLVFLRDSCDCISLCFPPDFQIPWAQRLCMPLCRWWGLQLRAR